MAGATVSTNLVTLPQVSARLTHIFGPDIIESLNSNVELFNVLQQNGRVKKAKSLKIEEKFHYARNSGAGWNTNEGSIGSAGNQGYTNGYGDLYTLQVPFQVTDIKNDASFAASADGIASILEDEISRAMDDLVVLLEAALWGLQSDTSNACYGLQDGVYDGSTGTYFGIDRAAYAFMQNHVLSTGSNRDISKALLNQAYRYMLFGSGSAKTGTTASWAANDQGGSKPSHLCTTPGITDKYDEVVLGANPRFLIDRAAKMGADAGVLEAAFKNVRFLSSRFAKANQVRFIDINDWALHILPHHYLLPGETQVRETAVAIKFLGRTGSFRSGYLEIRLNLVCNKPGNQVLLDDITE